MTNLKLIETYYDSAKTIFKERCYEDEQGLWQGLVESFYENGNLMRRFTCKDDSYHGLYECFFENGQLEERCMYKDGLLNGLYELILKRIKKMSDTIELKITTITEDKSTWPPCHVGFVLEWDGGSHCCRGEDEYIYFYTSDSYKKIIDCIGLRWSPMPEFSVNKEEKKEDSSSKSAIVYDLMRFAEKLNLGHCIGDFEIRVPTWLFDKIDYEVYTETRGWTRHAGGCHNYGLDSMRLHYNGSGNVLTLTKFDDGKNARPV